MKLNRLIENLDVIEVTGSVDVDVKDIAYHTRDVVDDGSFVAISGNAVDGHDYIETAVDNGAIVVVSSKPVDVRQGVTNIVVENPRAALAHMSAVFFGEPSKSFRLVGVTGTNGKTTITYLLEAIWKACGMNPGVVGTVNYRYGSVLTNPEHTTPESYELQRLFRNMVDAGVDVVAMEVSSHSLDQGRVRGCYFDGAVFTNLTQDHLDYHLDMERYSSAKALLFNKYLPGSSKKNIWAVINADDEFGKQIAKKISYKSYFYSLVKDESISLKDAAYSLDGTKMVVSVEGQKLKLNSGLIGKHNASNVLGAVGAAHAFGVSMSKIKEGVESVGFVPGRLEPISNQKRLKVFVDYAHTPDALKNVTTALKELNPKRLITVFGCGGDRDRAKRPQMGYEAALGSDIVIITSDNPRGENPLKIIEEVLTGVKELGVAEYDGGRFGYLIESNRKKAIAKALSIAVPGDVVLIAGKGHEDYQIVGKEKYPFDDKKIASEILEARE